MLTPHTQGIFGKPAKSTTSWTKMFYEKMKNETEKRRIRFYEKILNLLKYCIFAKEHIHSSVQKSIFFFFVFLFPFSLFCKTIGFPTIYIICGVKYRCDRIGKVFLSSVMNFWMDVNRVQLCIHQFVWSIYRMKQQFKSNGTLSFFCVNEFNDSIWLIIYFAQ